MCILIQQPRIDYRVVDKVNKLIGQNILYNRLLWGFLKNKEVKNSFKEAKKYFKEKQISLNQKESEYRDYVKKMLTIVEQQTPGGTIFVAPIFVSNYVFQARLPEYFAWVEAVCGYLEKS